MKNKLITAIYLFLVVSILGVTATAQEQADAKLAALSPGRFFASFKTKVEPANGFDAPTSELRFDSTAIHRVWMDKKTGTYFGYDVQVEPLADKRFKLLFGPLTLPMGSGAGVGARAKGSSSGSGASEMTQPSGTMRFPAPQIIEDGDTVALDVLINPQTGAKLIDLITVSSDNQSIPTAPSTRAPRDFSVDDVFLTMLGTELLINGETQGPSASCSGRLIYFYLEGRGRFVFSIRPHDDYKFEKTGEIIDNKISFTIDGDKFEWISKVPIVGRGGNWTLWVLHEPDYRLSFKYFENSKFIVGAMDDVKSLHPEE